MSTARKFALPSTESPQDTKVYRKHIVDHRNNPPTNRWKWIAILIVILFVITMLGIFFYYNKQIKMINNMKPDNIRKTYSTYEGVKNYALNTGLKIPVRNVNF